jgi:hypothetical protein
MSFGFRICFNLVNINYIRYYQVGNPGVQMDVVVQGERLTVVDRIHIIPNTGDCGDLGSWEEIPNEPIEAGTSSGTSNNNNANSTSRLLRIGGSDESGISGGSVIISSDYSASSAGSSEESAMMASSRGLASSNAGISSNAVPSSNHDALTSSKFHNALTSPKDSKPANQPARKRRAAASAPIFSSAAPVVSAGGRSLTFQWKPDIAGLYSICWCGNLDNNGCFQHNRFKMRTGTLNIARKQDCKLGEELVVSACSLEV